MLVLVRIDARLIHGQVIEGWLPFLKVPRIVVADDDAATSPLTQAAFAVAMPPGLQLKITSLAESDFQKLAIDSIPTLLLLRDIGSATRARALGLPPTTLNVGNVPSGPGKTGFSRSVFLDASELAQLHALAKDGFAVTLQATPGEAAIPLKPIAT